MNFKLISLICLITTFLFEITAKSVQLAWEPSPDSTVTGYKIYWGTNTHSYTQMIDVGNVTNVVISNTNFLYNSPYYFAATAYDPTAESDFSNEAIWTNSPQSIVYVGVKLDYGTNIFSLSSQRIMVMAVTNQSGNFYRESLIITNNPFVGVKPADTNKYVYLGTLIDYGTNIFNLNSLRTGIWTFTNPPAYYYRSSLILTNNPF